MKSAAIACLLTLFPIVASADYVASEEEEAALRARISRNPPTAATLTAEPYPGSKLDVTCSASQSAPRQPGTMVYCFYTKDAPNKVEAYLAGPGKPAEAVSVFANGDQMVVDENNNVLIDGVTQVTYYVRTSAPVARQQAAPAQATAPQASAAPETHAEASQGTAQAPAADAGKAQGEPSPTEKTDVVEETVDQGKKLKSLLGF